MEQFREKTPPSEKDNLGKLHDEIRADIRNRAAFMKELRSLLQKSGNRNKKFVDFEVSPLAERVNGIVVNLGDDFSFSITLPGSKDSPLGLKARPATAMMVDVMNLRNGKNFGLQISESKENIVQLILFYRAIDKMIRETLARGGKVGLESQVILLDDNQIDLSVYGLSDSALDIFMKSLLTIIYDEKDKLYWYEKS